MTRLRMHSLNCIIPQTLDDFRGDPLHVLAVGFNPQRSPQVGRPPHLVETAELLQVASQGPIQLLLLTAAKQFFHGSVQKDDRKSCPFQQIGIIHLREGAAAHGHHLGRSTQVPDQRTQGCVFYLAKRGFSGLLEYLLNRAAFLSFDPLVQIFEWPAQLTAQGQAYAALARAHEAHKEYGPRPVVRRRLRHRHNGRGLPTGSVAHAWRPSAEPQYMVPPASLLLCSSAS